MDSILEIKNLSVEFEGGDKTVRAVQNLDLNIQRKSVHAIVGESGSGKSVTALSILKLINHPGKITSGEMIFHSHGKESVDLLKLSEKKIRKFRGKDIAMIFQEPMTSLNPVYTIGDQIMEAITLHEKVTRRHAKELALDMLQKVGIPNPMQRFDDYPHQMSGGMRQRVMIAMALSCKPELLIADEPTTALDVTIQAQILELIHSLIDELEMSLILITHDLGVVAEQADFVSVMYAGKIVEEAPKMTIFDHPKHPYTHGLLKSIPGTTLADNEKLYTIPGTVPDLSNLSLGCAYHNRCEKKQDNCLGQNIELQNLDGIKYRCAHPY